MEFWNCEYCNAYVTNVEVHYCRNFGNQHRQSSATLPQFSSANWVQDVDSRSALPLTYDSGWPAMSQINSSTQQSVLPNIHQATSCEETATAEIPSPYDIANQNQYNPETSDFLFPNMPHDQENHCKTSHLPVSDQHYPMPVTEPCSLPGFQQTSGRRSSLMNQIAQYPNASSEMDCSVIYRTDEMSPHFISYSNENFNTSANLMSQDHETSTEMPILAVQNAQYNPMDPVPPTDSTGQIHSSKCPKDFQPKYHLKPSELSRSVKRPYACNYCDKTFPFPSDLTRHIRTHTGEKPYKCTVCIRCFTNSFDLTKHMRLHTGEKPYKCKQCGKCFAQSSTLRGHFSSFHTGDAPHKCTECGLSCKQTEVLCIFSKGFSHYTPGLAVLNLVHLPSKQRKSIVSTVLHSTNRALPYLFIFKMKDQIILKFIIAGILETNTVKVPQPSSRSKFSNLVQDVDSRLALPMNYEEGRKINRINTFTYCCDQLNPMPVAEPRLLPGFQQAFGQRNALTNQLAQLPNASSKWNAREHPARM
ncbi:hypothetical protein CEXT_672261 [Caerostris extrusa]|uniref:C2H2-type domain-containing protein n=1 Tax=Caerostris extrusa TaxID=172846 RepID=A0AAV4QB21_CAEEX|nr:hypothetical protein CEXT_672261 [Caerostris extrusa]